MKKKLLCMVVLAMIIPILITSASAVCDDKTVVKYYDDGSYLTEEINEYTVRASGSKTGSKSHTYYNSDDTALWKVTLTGKFTYTGSTSSCTSSSISSTMYDSAWYTISKSASKSGKKATGTASIGEKLLGVTVRTIPVNLSLSCDANGKLS